MPSNSTNNIQDSAIGTNITGDKNNTYIDTINVNSQAKELPFNKFPMPRPITTFHGRDEIMNDIDSLFFVKNKKKVVLHGLPGYGKSELSKQYAERCLNNGNIEEVVWIHAEKIEESYPELIQIYRQCSKKCLFILDNGVCRRDISDYEPPPKNNFYMLITSHSMGWWADVVPLKVQPLEKEFAIEVLKSILRDNYGEKYKYIYVELAAMVDYVPLGLQVIGGYMHDQDLQNLDLENYVQDIKQSRECIMNEKISQNIQNNYEKSINGAMMVSLNKIINYHKTDVKQLALDVLYICSYLNPDNITIEELSSIDIIKEKAHQIIRSIKLLINYSFVYNDVDKSKISLHRLTQEFLRNFLIVTDKYKYFTSCLRYIMHDQLKYSYTHALSVFSNVDNDNKSTILIIDNIIKQSCYLNSCICDSDQCIIEKTFICLVNSGSFNCLHKYFAKNYKFGIKDVIDKYSLLYYAITNNQIEAAKLLFKYVNQEKYEKLKCFICLAAKPVNFQTIDYLFANGIELNVHEAGDCKFYVAENISFPKYLNEILTTFYYSPVTWKLNALSIGCKYMLQHINLNVDGYININIEERHKLNNGFHASLPNVISFFVFIYEHWYIVTEGSEPRVKGAIDEIHLHYSDSPSVYHDRSQAGRTEWGMGFIDSGRIVVHSNKPNKPTFINSELILL